MIRDVLDVATPRLRPAWRGRTKPLTGTELQILRMAIESDPLPYQKIYELVGGERAWTLLNGLKKQGALDHPGYNRWRITEKGRIALALAQTQDSR